MNNQECINQDRINMLEEIKLDISNNFSQICRYHQIDNKIIYNAENNIENIFDWIIEFYKQDILHDKTRKKALMIMMANPISNLNVPIINSGAYQSPIEFLLFSALDASMPLHVKEHAYLMPQVSVCNGKYILDIALMERKYPIENGVEGVPIVGIECDGYNHHYDDPDKAARTQERIRNIEMDLGIHVFSYTGKEIYTNFTKLAKFFWDYVEQKIYTVK